MLSLQSQSGKGNPNRNHTSKQEYSLIYQDGLFLFLSTGAWFEPSLLTGFNGDLVMCPSWLKYPSQIAWWFDKDKSGIADSIFAQLQGQQIRPAFWRRVTCSYRHWTALDHWDALRVLDWQWLKHVETTLRHATAVRSYIIRFCMFLLSKCEVEEAAR